MIISEFANYISKAEEAVSHFKGFNLKVPF